MIVTVKGCLCVKLKKDHEMITKNHKQKHEPTDDEKEKDEDHEEREKILMVIEL
jgi:hypothetical protein